MNILVVNIGSTSLKFRLFDMTRQRVLARGGVEGVGQPDSRVTLWRGTDEPTVAERHVADQAEAVHLCVDELRRMGSEGEPLALDAIGFKAVHGGSIAGAVRVTPEVLGVMEEFTAAAPAHNPPYVAAMRAFGSLMPDTPLVAAFETGFHQTVPEARTTYAIPHEWTTKYGVRRYGFHGASHRYVATRTAEILGREDLKIISCHLGGSSSLCAIRAGRSIATSLGMTPQTGVPQNNRVGDFDAYALLVLRDRTGLDVDTLLATMANEGGLLGISGLSGSMEKITAAAAEGHERSQLALDVFVESVRDYVGAYLVALGGLDALVFTAGIGERSALVRQRICAGLDFLGIRLDAERNEAGGDGVLISSDDSAVKILTIQTNEELIVARQTQAVLTTGIS